MTLAEVGTRFTMQEDKHKGPYYILFPPGDNLVLIALTPYEERFIAWDHPNLAAKLPLAFEQKHYRRGGSKFWSTHVGIDHFFVVPKTNIELIEKPGLSYVYIRVGKLDYIMNVSGGGSGAWTDWVSHSVHLVKYQPVRSLKNLAENAVPAAQCRNLGIIEDIEKEAWRDPVMFERIALQEIPRQLGIDSVIIANRKPYAVVNINHKRRLMVGKNDQGHWRIRYSDIEWFKTAQANNIVLPQCAAFNRTGTILERNE